MRGQKHLRRHCVGPMHRETPVTEGSVTFENCLPLDTFENAERIVWQWVEMVWKKCARDSLEARNKGMWGNKWPATDLRAWVGQKVRGYHPALQNTVCIVLIHRVSNACNMILSPKQLQASYTNVRHWEQLIDLMNRNKGLRVPQIRTSMFNCNLEQVELDKDYMGWYTHGEMIIDPIYGQISYNCFLSNAFKVKLGHNLKTFLVEWKSSTGKQIVGHLIGAANVIPASHDKARCGQLLINIQQL